MSPPKRRLLMTTDAVGGVWTYAATLARRLCRDGHDVTLVTMGPRPRRAQMDVVAGIDGLTVEVTDLALEWMDPEGDDLVRARDTLLHLTADVRPDVVHLNSFREAAFGFEVPTLVVAHSCVASWWQACRPGQPVEPRWSAYVRNVRAGLDAADLWVAPTVAFYDWIEGFYRPRSQGLAIWNGADPAADAADRIVDKSNVILAAGRLWDEAKNMVALTRVARSLDWPVAVAGPLQTASGGAAAAPNVHPLGELPHQAMLAEMQRAAVFAAPALYEPFGLGILEAAACGCALVLSDIPSLRELWRGAALLVPPGDDAALRDALQAIARDSTLRSELGAAARRRARSYSVDAMVRDYQHLYRQLVETRPTSCPAPALELSA